MCGQDIEELRGLIASRQAEIVALDDQLREAVRQKRLLDLPALVQQLLAVKPDHPYAQPLAEQVVEATRRSGPEATGRASLRRGPAAAGAVAPHNRNPGCQELYRRTAELAWLAGDLRHAPGRCHAAGGRTAIPEPGARRPAGGEAVRRGGRRLRLAQAPERRTAVAWASPPAETPLGVPVDWLGGFRRLTLATAQASESDLLRSPGRLAVACGLALAGLKQAPLRINLLAAAEKGIFSRASRFLRAQAVRGAWGLDLGPSGLKAVKLCWDESQRQARIEAAALVEHAKPLSHAANEAEEHRLVAETIKTFLAQHETKAQRVCVGLPGRLALARQFDLPPVEAAKAPRLVEFEAQQQFPVPLDQLAWDYQFFDEPPGAGQPAKTSGDLWRRALLVGAQEAAVRTLGG